MLVSRLMGMGLVLTVHVVRVELMLTGHLVGVKVVLALHVMDLGVVVYLDAACVGVQVCNGCGNGIFFAAVRPSKFWHSSSCPAKSIGNNSIKSVYSFLGVSVLNL